MYVSGEDALDMFINVIKSILFEAIIFPVILFYYNIKFGAL